jgi:hypothetical protein
MTSEHEMWQRAQSSPETNDRIVDDIPIDRPTMVGSCNEHRKNAMHFVTHLLRQRGTRSS